MQCRHNNYIAFNYVSFNHNLFFLHHLLLLSFLHTLYTQSQLSSEASVFTMAADSSLYTPLAGRFRFEYHCSDNAQHNSTNAHASSPLQLCAQFPDSGSSSSGVSCPYHLAADDDCEEVGSRVVTGLLTMFYLLNQDINQCIRFSNEDF